MKKISELQKIIDAEIQAVQLDGSPQELYEPIKYVLSNGGKRLRPLFLLIAYQLFDEKVENAMSQAIGVEIFHNFTLVHDDIMDNALIRRNKPTVHNKWKQNVAILSGDAMLIKAYEMILNCNSALYKSILHIFNDAALKVCEGQQYDMNFEKLTSIREDEYIKMIELKTSSLIAASFKIGAVMGGAMMDEANLLYDFGKNIGTAFQLQDDFLDAFGKSEQFGKKIGGDINAKKKTYLYIKALELVSHKEREEFLKLYGNDSTEPAKKIKRVISLYKRLNLHVICKERINHYFNKSLKILNDLNVNKEHKEMLRNYISRLVNRER